MDNFSSETIEVDKNNDTKENTFDYFCRKLKFKLLLSQLGLYNIDTVNTDSAKRDLEKKCIETLYTEEDLNKLRLNNNFETTELNTTNELRSEVMDFQPISNSKASDNKPETQIPQKEEDTQVEILHIDSKIQDVTQINGIYPSIVEDILKKRLMEDMPLPELVQIEHNKLDKAFNNLIDKLDHLALDHSVKKLTNPRNKQCKKYIDAVEQCYQNANSKQKELYNLIKTNDGSIYQKKNSLQQEFTGYSTLSCSSIVNKLYSCAIEP